MRNEIIPTCVEHLDSALVSLAVSRFNKVLIKISNADSIMTDSEENKHLSHVWNIQIRLLFPQLFQLLRNLLRVSILLLVKLY